jgi:hypothetical protein
MGQYLQVNGDYNIKTAEGGRITLDTGAGVGDVRITGNLLVEGETLTVSAENLQVNDNIITLNYGEPGAGVTLIYSGIEVDRGSLTRAAVIYNETDDSWGFAYGSAISGYSFGDSKIKTRTIVTDPAVDDGDLTLIGSGTGVLKVYGTLNYENQISDDDDIPNKKYVDDAIQNQPARQIISDANTPANPTGTPTRVIASDVQSGDTDFLGIPVTESEVAIIVDDIPNSVFYTNRAKIQDLAFFDNNIVNEDTNSNIILTTNGTGKVETTYGIQINHIASTPASAVNNTIVYAANPSSGSTGLFFVNTSTNGEFISKNKALVFSMLF